MNPNGKSGLTRRPSTAPGSAERRLASSTRNALNAGGVVGSKRMSPAEATFRASSRQAEYVSAFSLYAFMPSGPGYTGRRESLSAVETALSRSAAFSLLSEKALHMR